jgi:hypothetical protein
LLVIKQRSDKLGIYNTQYESYYSKFTGNKRGYNPYAGNIRGNNRVGKSKLNGSYFAKRFLRELIGVFFMLMLVLMCKAIVTPQTMAAYQYSKNIVNTNYDYTYLVDKIKSINITSINDLQGKLQDFIETLKIRISGGETIKDKVKNNFILPVNGEVMLDDGKNGVNIAAFEGSKVIAAYDGTVKEVGEKRELGKYILIDHGNGIESKYSYLSEIDAKKDNEVKKGDLIGKSGDSHKSTSPSLHFDLYYMGESLSPIEYMDFKVN